MLNISKVLAVDRRDDKLVVCGSVKQGSCTKFHLSDISSAPEAVVEAVAANTEVRRLLADQLITLCFPGGIHFCIHWPTAVQPLVEQVNTLLFLPSFRPKTQLEKVGKTGEKIPTGGLSPPLHPPLFPSFPARARCHLPPHAMSANIIQPFFVLQPATLSLLSFSRILFSFFLKGKLSGSPMPPLIGLDQSPSASWLSSSEVS